MLRWHRLIATILLPLLIYVIATGLGIEAWDVQALVRHAPPSDMNLQLQRQHINGTPNYVVVSVPDYVAPALPADTDYAGQIERAAALGRAALPGEPLKLVELRGMNGRLAGHVAMGDHQLIFDLASGARLPSSALPPPQPVGETGAERATFKYFHAFRFLPFQFAAISGLAGMALAGLVLTGLLQYVRLYAARRRMKRNQPFWSVGRQWRDLHRWVAIVAALPLAWLAVTGFALSVDNVAIAVRMMASSPPAPAANAPGHMPPPPPAFFGDFSKPMRDAELPAMTDATLAAFHAQYPGMGIRVLRLRYFAGYAQGVIIAADEATSQLVFNTRTGARMSMTEPGYPDVGFPTGWEGHQYLKKLHRGDAFGLTGRWLDLAGGLGGLFLTISGAVMVIERSRQRRKTRR
ncbi:PepSY-associated TM helix domain-containing protein [Novosphingobium terrae]|uniref:PepSY-associated TM helix domain-containing protein n=1 Tax=Novosphingobium terrae TaxID=2726189 RepID=UPI00197E2A89|nr:PepSY-associated TM helix domain-containing protein [Novosphingobium terrae]